MKEATTPYSKAIQENMQINRKFLESKGWVIKQEFPLYMEGSLSLNYIGATKRLKRNFQLSTQT
jgi:hypothetical protein